MRRQPSIVQYAIDDLNNNDKNNEAKKVKAGKDNVAFQADEISMTEQGQGFNLDDGPGKKMTLRKPLEVYD